VRWARLGALRLGALERVAEATIRSGRPLGSPPRNCGLVRGIWGRSWLPCRCQRVSRVRSRRLIHGPIKQVRWRLRPACVVERAGPELRFGDTANDGSTRGAQPSTVCGAGPGAQRPQRRRAALGGGRTANESLQHSTCARKPYFESCQPSRGRGTCFQLDQGDRRFAGARSSHSPCWTARSQPSGEEPATRVPSPEHTRDQISSAFGERRQVETCGSAAFRSTAAAAAAGNAEDQVPECDDLRARLISARQGHDRTALKARRATLL